MVLAAGDENGKEKERGEKEQSRPRPIEAGVRP